MNDKNKSQVASDIRKDHYSHLKQQYAMNMQIKVAMETYDTDMKERLERELEKVQKQMRDMGG